MENAFINQVTDELTDYGKSVGETHQPCIGSVPYDFHPRVMRAGALHVRRGSSYRRDVRMHACLGGGAHHRMLVYHPHRHRYRVPQTAVHSSLHTPADQANRHGGRVGAEDHRGGE